MNRCGLVRSPIGKLCFWKIQTHISSSGNPIFTSIKSPFIHVSMVQARMAYNSVWNALVFALKLYKSAIYPSGIVCVSIYFFLSFGVVMYPDLKIILHRSSVTFSIFTVPVQHFSTILREAHAAGKYCNRVYKSRTDSREIRF